MRARALLDDSLLGKVAVGVVVVVVELEEAQASLGALAAQRRGAALGLGESDDIGLGRLGDGDGGKGLGRERLLRDARGEGEEVHEGLAVVGAAGRHGDGWGGGSFFGGRFEVVVRKESEGSLC